MECAESLQVCVTPPMHILFTDSDVPVFLIHMSPYPNKGVRAFYFYGGANMDAKRKYTWRGLRLYDPKVYEKFKEVCVREMSNPSRELNYYMLRCAEIGHIPTINTER